MVIGEVKVESHNMASTFSWLTSLLFNVNRVCHSWVMTFSKFDLYQRHNDIFTSCVHWTEMPAQQHSWHSSRPPWWQTADQTTDARKNKEKGGSSLYARQPHLASTYRSKNFLTHPPTLLACFIIWASFETIKVLVTHRRTQKTHGENIITETLTAVPNSWHSNDAVTMQQGTCNKWAIDQYDVTDVKVSTKHVDTTTVQHTQHHGNTAVIPRLFKMNNVEYICTKCFENFATEDEYNFHLENNHPGHCEIGNAISVECISSSSVHRATEHLDAPIFIPHDSLGDLWPPQ